MGADLYIKNMDREKQYTGFEVSKKAVNQRYFRDCYNSYGLFRFLSCNLNKEFSWWQFRDNKEWFDKNGNSMKIKGTIKFKDIFLEAKEKLKKKKYYCLKIPNDKWSLKKQVYDTKKLSKKEIKKFLDWLDLLIEFLSLAIEQKSKIIWSV